MHRRHFLSLSLGSMSIAAMSPMTAFSTASVAVPDALKNNPLLDFSGLPNFAAFKPSDIKPAIDFLLAYNKEVVQFVANQETPTWNNFYLPLQNAQNQLDRAWHIVGHLNSVKNSDALRTAYTAAQKDLSDYSTWYGMYRPLYDGFVKLKNSKDYDSYSQAQKQTILNALKDFELSGINLTGDKAKRYGEISKRLSELSTKFGNNVLDATMGFEIVIKESEKERLKGLNDDAIERAKKSAKDKGKDGYRFTLDYPSYIAVMTYADDRALREEIYSAYLTRASDKGVNAGKWDNTKIMQEIVALRHERANLLGYPSYADYALATRMAKNTSEVLGFLNKLLTNSREKAKVEVATLENFGKSLPNSSIDTLKPWDINYLAEKERLAKYSIDQEVIREYFVEDVVLSGMFKMMGELFDFSVKEIDTKANAIKVWHDDVRFFELYRNGTHIASFYLDMYAREHKRGGAWMNSAVERIKNQDGSIQLPVAHIVCNFTKPNDGKPSMLLHSEVTTLFHEFGHAIHQMLTQVHVLAVSGINGVAWDAVEFPSQLLENWTWDKTALKQLSKHYKTGEPLSDEMIDKMLAAKNHLAARNVVRQLEFGLFDFRLHTEYRPDGKDHITNIRNAIKTEVAIVPEPEWTRMANSFNHIFAGGYAAGYYSYLWADVLSSDAYTRFEKEGIFNPSVGKAYIDAFLGQGGSDEPMHQFVKFMGREPDPNALLISRGIL